MRKLLLSLLLTACTLPAVAQPTVSSITPASGLVSGGEYVHLHGANLVGPPLVCPAITCFPYVRFGDAAGTIVDNTTTEMVVVAPPHAAGAVDVQVNVPGAPPITITGGFRYDDPQTTDTVRFLVPVAISAAGALGTNWRTEVFLNNASPEAFALGGGTTSASGTIPTIAGSATTALALYPPAGNTGAFVYIPKRLVDNVTVSLRVHDTTRDSDSWGTEVPVVPETQFKREAVLVGVPTDARYRTLLRVYSYNASETPVRIDLRDDATGELLTTQSALLKSGIPSVSTTTPPTAPAYAQIALDSILAPFAATHSRIRAEVTSTFAPAPPIWAFVSITNNATQQVTTVTPGLTHPSPSGSTSSAALAPGHWAGGGACVDVAQSQVTVRNGCTVGTFTPPVVGADGHFEVDGMFTAVVGPPGAGGSVPAHFSGDVRGGNTLSLTIATTTGTVGPLTVQFGSQEPCPQACP
jgi:hypothetical protein